MEGLMFESQSRFHPNDFDILLTEIGLMDNFLFNIL